MKVLVIDDEANIASLFEAYLEVKGSHEIILAHSGTEGLAKAKEHLPDLIILDIQMPDLSGFDVIEGLRKDAATAAIPVILSSVTEGPSVEDKMRLGIVDFLRKPVDFEKLGELVREVKEADPEFTESAFTPLGEGSRRLKVVIIEDDEEELHLMTFGLEKLGCEVHAALDGEKGIRLVEEILPDIIVLDYLLPTMSGVDIMRRLKSTEATCEIPIVLVSAYLSMNYKSKVFVLREPKGSSKPLSIEDLCSRIAANRPQK